MTATPAKTTINLPLGEGNPCGVVENDVVSITNHAGRPYKVALVVTVTWSGFVQARLQAPHRGIVQFHAEDLYECEQSGLWLNERFLIPPKR